MVTFSQDDNQLRQICVLAEPLPRPLRSASCCDYAGGQLAGAEPGDGSTARAARGVLVKVLKAERLMR